MLEAVGSLLPLAHMGSRAFRRHEVDELHQARAQQYSPSLAREPKIWVAHEPGKRLKSDLNESFLREMKAIWSQSRRVPRGFTFKKSFCFPLVTLVN